jgi:hypothetical protein
MRRKAQLVAILFGWMLATGAQWDVAQVFAWGRMFLMYAGEVPVARALKMTFAPENMCAVCKAVNAAKQQDNPSEAPGGRADVKVTLFVQASSQYIFHVGERPTWGRTDLIPGDAPDYRPPLEPPRAAA